MRLLYVSPADLRANEITQKILKNLSQQTILTALSNASSLADSYISSRYATPFLSYGDDFKRAVTDIAVYDLISGRGLNLEGNDANFRMRYEDAVKWLSRVNAGTITPEGQGGGSTGGGDTPTGSGGGFGGGGARVVSTGRRRGW